MEARQTEPAPRDRSTGQLVGELSSQTSELIRKEIQLAQAELTEKGKRAGLGAGIAGGGAALGYLAAMALTAAVIALLDKAMDFWVAALIVAVVYSAVAAALAIAGRNRIQEAMPPIETTTETIKEDVQWAKSQAKSVRR